MTSFSSLSVPLSTIDTERAAARLDELYVLVKQNWPGFIEREGQVTLMRSTLETLLNARTDSHTVTDGGNLAALEAGTGTGKTIGYCLAAIVASEMLGMKVVVSTATVALQEQLYFKDLPQLLKFIPSLTFELMKGRSRYVCKSKLEMSLNGDVQDDWLDALDDGDTSQDAPAKSERRLDDKTIVWLKEINKALDKGQWNGEVDSLGAMPDEAEWKVVQADGNACQGANCAHYKDCSFFLARRKAAGATLQIANHSLVLAALSNESTLFDPAKTLFVFDEAHHLPDIANSQFSYRMRLGHSVKALTGLRKAMQGGIKVLESGSRPELSGVFNTMETCKQQLNRIDDFFVESNIVSADAPQYRYPHGEVPQDLAQETAQLGTMLGAIAASAMELRTLLIKDDEAASPKIKETRGKAANDIGPHMVRVAAMRDLFTAWSTHDAVPLAKWIEWVDNSVHPDAFLCASPLTGAQGLNKGLWKSVAAAVCTSATLSACGSFDFFARLSGLNRYPAHRSGVMPSPFDYKRQGTLNIAPMKNSPKSAGYADELARALPDILSGHLLGQLVLFTSKRQMNASYEALPIGLRERVLLQNTASRQHLLALHRTRVEAGEMSILFGLQSMGEGLDLPGALCEHVVIDKLPFTPPTSPVEEALSEWLAEQNRDSFNELSVPRVSMKLAQWVGRAIRTVDDTATVTICDNRLRSTGYGRKILKGLPPFSLGVAATA